VSMAEIAESAKEGLLALAAGTGLQVLAAMFDEDVTRLCGPDGKHNPGRAGYRHGSEAGSVTLGGRRIPVTRPRVRAADGSGELHLPSYDLFSSTEILSQMAMEKMLAGLSSRRYGHGLEPAGRVVEAQAAATSKSAVSRRFVAATETALEQLMTRRLDELDLVAFMADGVHFGEHTCVVALGIDIDGVKHPLAIEEGSTENATLVTELITGLRDRGLDVTMPILAVPDGSKALSRAVKDVFDQPLIQRCQQHRSCKESTCCVGGRGVRRGCRGGQQVAAGAVAGWRWRGHVPGLAEERAGFADGVADGGPADVQEAGQHVHRAQAPLVEDGQQDAFTVADLLVEDTAAGFGLAGAAAPLIAEAFGLGGLQGGEPLDELLQAGTVEPGQRRVRELVDDLGPLGRGVAVEERAERLRGGKTDWRRAGGVAVIFEGFPGFPDQVSDAGGGDFEQVGEHVHGARLPLVEEGEQDAGGVVEQRPGAKVAGGPAGAAAALLAIALLGAGGLKRGQRGAQSGQFGAGHPGQPLIAQLAEHLLATAGRAGALASGAFADGRAARRRVEGVVPGGVGGVPPQRQGAEALLADRDASGVVARI
jgi:hypothetical protein